MPVEAPAKGVPASWVGRTTDEVLGTPVSALPTPRMTLDRVALDHNLALMADWCADQGLRLAPHGKTTMAPQLFAAQADHGAWAITVANPAQAMVARSVGLSRVLVANELVDPVGMAALADELRRDPDFELWCFADSVDGVRLLAAGLGEGLTGRVRVLVEVGLDGGRAGCRSIETALQVATAAAAAPPLLVSGVAGWEGAYGSGLDESSLDRVDALLQRLRDTTVALHAADLFGQGEVVVSAGGSAYPDRVVAALAAPWPFDVGLVLRSGAYVTHDHRHYADLSPFGGRGGATQLRPALHAWATVLSRPEPALAILDAGKRDVAYDLDLPIPLDLHRLDGSVEQLAAATVTAVNDQHLFLTLPPDSRVAVGDVVRLGLSHPCTVFDKWQLLPVLDDEGRVVDLVRTFF
jgi:D-serine deaminase-like pyridoxal phosphate-dependent protein